jgi:predicted LPLAT superfamily acyltransferase
MARTPIAQERSSPADWTRNRERSNRGTLRLMSWIAVHGGRRLARLLLWPITAYFLLFPGPVGRHSQRYLTRALGRPAGWRDRWRHVFTFAATVLDRVYFLRDMRRCFELQVTGAEHLQAVLAQGRGAILVGGHVGSFEALSAAGRQLANLDVAMAMYPDNARLINETLEAIAPGFQMRIIALGQRSAMLSIRDWLDAGRVVGLLADRGLPGADKRDETLWVPFLGQEAPFTLGPWRLAQLLRRPVVFMAGLYNGGRRYELRFEPLADFSTAPADAAGRERALHDAARAYAARLESICRTAPYNWFNFHDFWQEAGGTGLRADRVRGTGLGAGAPGADGSAGPDQVR